MKEQLLIIHLINDLNSEFHRNFCRELHKSPHMHYIFSTYVERRHKDAKIPLAVNVKLYQLHFFAKWLRLFALIPFAWRLAWLRRKYTGVRIHAHDAVLDGLLAKGLKAVFGGTYVVVIRGSDVNHNNLVKTYLLRTALRDASAVVVKSAAYVPKVKAVLPDANIRIIPNGVDTFWQQNIHTKPYPFDVSRPFRIITVGDFTENKNIHLLINVLQELRAEGFDIQHYIAGNPNHDFKETVEKMIAEHPFVTYLGFLSKEELCARYREMDLFCLCSKSETFGLVYIEALTQGLPVVLTKGQAIDGMLPPGAGAAVLAEAPEIKALIRRIIRREVMLTPPSAGFFEKFRWINILQEYHHIYEN